MNTQLFIPSRIKVGFQKRQDTYTGKLAYVIYYDKKGVLRKETSWLGWIEQYITKEEFQAKKLENYNQRIDQILYSASKNGGKTYSYLNNNGKDVIVNTREDVIEKCLGPLSKYQFNLRGRSDDPSINPVDFDNVPTSGFVLNKGVGGVRQSYGWNARNEYIRIYDPRNFEFEISVANLLFILQESNCMRGKGLEGEFIYAWDGKDLVLLPTTCSEYQNSLEFTGLKSKKVAAKELIIGATYETKDQKKMIYLGQFNNFYYSDWRSDDDERGATLNRTHVYYNPKSKGHNYEPKFNSYTDMSQIAQLIDPTPVANYAELVDELNKQPNFGAYEEIFVMPVNQIKMTYSYWEVRRNDEYKYNKLFYKQLSDNSFAEYQATLTDHKEVAGSQRYSSSHYEYRKIRLAQTRIITFNEDGTIEHKTKNVKDENLYTKEQIIGMDLKHIRLKIKNYKKKITLARTPN